MSDDSCCLQVPPEIYATKQGRTIVIIAMGQPLNKTRRYTVAMHQDYRSVMPPGIKWGNQPVRIEWQTEGVSVCRGPVRKITRCYSLDPVELDDNTYLWCDEVVPNLSGASMVDAIIDEQVIAQFIQFLNGAQTHTPFTPFSSMCGVGSSNDKPMPEWFKGLKRIHKK